MTEKIHRLTSSSKGGRQLMARQGRIDRGPGLTPEQQAWNGEVERKAAERERAKPLNLIPAPWMKKRGRA